MFESASGVSLDIGGLRFFFTKTHELIAITVHIIACMDHFVIGEPTSMIHSVTAM